MARKRPSHGRNPGSIPGESACTRKDGFSRFSCVDVLTGDRIAGAHFSSKKNEGGGAQTFYARRRINESRALPGESARKPESLKATRFRAGMHRACSGAYRAPFFLINAAGEPSPA